MDYPSQASLVRRTDVALRAAYPHLTTRLFEIARNRFVIAFERDMLAAGSIAEEFDSEIRPVTVEVGLSNQIPAIYVRELEPITDDAIADGLEGFSFTTSDIQDILLSQFPDLPAPITTDAETLPTITLLFPSTLSPEQGRAVEVFFRRHLPGWPIAIGISNQATPKSTASIVATTRDPLEIRPARLRPSAPHFVREDEVFWFDNIEAIYRGRLQPQSFAGLTAVGFACYVDATSFPQIDLRQAMLLYDTIFLAPPLAASQRHESFWMQQALTRQDVLCAVEAGRIRFVVSQPEERTDPRLLAAAYERNPNAVIGRRTAAALLISDIVQTSCNYTLAREDLRSDVVKLAEVLATEAKLPTPTLIRLLLWPLHARRACMAAFLDRGLLGLARFNLGTILGEELQAATGRDVRLEALMTSDAVHIAHALNATYIPPLKEMEGWLEPRRIIGQRLNFYRNFNGCVAAVWAQNERRKELRQTILPPLPLFEFDRYACIDEIISLTSLSSTRRKGRSLVTRLSELAPDARSAEIERLGRELRDLGGRRSRRSLNLDTASAALDVVVAAAGIAVPPIPSAWILLKRLAGSRMFDKLRDAVEQDLNKARGQNSDLDFLSKVDRVAELRAEVL